MGSFEAVLGREEPSYVIPARLDPFFAATAGSAFLGRLAKTITPLP